MGVERCSKCTSPITQETVYLDKEGVCNVCKNWVVKDNVIDWKAREKRLIELIAEAKSKNRPYDCVIPYSGGKDSTFTLWILVKKYGVKPLVVSYDHWFYRPRTLENRKRTFRRMGVDVISFTPNWNVVRKIMLESLIRKGDSCWHCHAGVYVYPMKIAVKFKIPLVIWGEGGGEYEAYGSFQELEEIDEWKFNRRINLGMRAEDMAGFIGVDIRDVEPFIYPAKEEIDEAGVKSFPLGKFIPWNVKENVKIIKKELAWKEDEIESGFPGPTYEKIECMFQGVRDYVKYLKRCYARITHLTTLDIRHGRMGREEAMELIKKYEGKKPRSLEIFLEYIGLTEEEFNKIVAMHIIPPAVYIDPSTLPVGEKIWDHDLWFRDPEEDRKGAGNENRHCQL